MREVHRAVAALGDHSPKLLHERVVAVVEADGGERPGRGGALGEGRRLAGVVAVDPEWLLAHHVLAGNERRSGDGRMQAVGRADVHGVG